MFNIKTFAGVTADMIRHMQSTQDKVTDFHVGSVARTLVEAPAVEIDEFYQRVLLGLVEAIPVAIYQAFEFDQLPAYAAAGDVTFSVPLPVVEPITIPAGTIVQMPGTRIRYLTASAVQIAASTISVDARVYAEWAGVAGNTGTETVTEIVASLGDTVSVTNANPISGGRDAETPEERKARFIDYIGSLSRGTVWAVTYAARSSVIRNASGVVIEWVTRVGIIEGAGHVQLFIYSSGGTPSTELLNVAQATIDGSFDQQTQTWTPGYRPVGADVTVFPMIEREIDVSLRIKMLPGLTGDASTIALVRDALTSRFAISMPGDVVYIEQISESALTVLGVERVIVENNENILCGQNEVLVVGTLDVAWDTV